MAQSHAVKVGQYLVKGNADYATVIEKRFGKDYILEEFKGIKDGKDAFERAKNCAIDFSK
jgi:hypothetical protein